MQSAESARAVLKLLTETFTALEGQIAQLDGEINRRSKADPTARRLMTIPGVGPIIATAFAALVPAAQNFPAGRAFAAWLGSLGWRNQPAASESSAQSRNGASEPFVACW